MSFRLSLKMGIKTIKLLIAIDMLILVILCAGLGSYLAIASPLN